MLLKVLWAEEQSTKPRQKRDFIEIDPADIPKERVKRVSSTEVPYSVLFNDTKNVNKTRFKRRAIIPSEVDQTFNDELWNQQWYLVSTILMTFCFIPKSELSERYENKTGSS